MRKTFQRMRQRLQVVSRRIERRFQQTRRGTVLIMVVALLVLLALMGTAFIATARMDRLSAGQMKQLTSWQEIADSLAQQALSNAGTWIATDQQNFTSQSVNLAAGSTGTGTMFLANSAPSIFGPNSPGTGDTLMTGATTVTNKQAFVAWTHISQPIGYTFFTSPIVPSTIAPNYIANVNAPTNSYDLGPLGYLMVPTNVVISYPQGYTNTDLAGRTWTFPGFYRVYQSTGSTTAVPSWTKDGPFLAADATGWGVADSGLVALNIPPTQGISWFAAWRVVDDAALVNVNNAFTQLMDPDISNNCNNFFPVDVDLPGMLGIEFNQQNAQFPDGFGEWLNINFRRYAYFDDFNGVNSAANAWPVDDASVGHTDMTYATGAERAWTQLGRRLDYPAHYTGTVNTLAGDPLKNYQRPFDESDTGALSYRGVMVQSGGPASKFEQLEANRSNTGLTSPALDFANPPGNIFGDSIYGSAANYMFNSNSYFKFFEPTQVAYWYDWNFNFDYPYDWAGSTNPAHKATGASGLQIFNGLSSVTTLSRLTLGNQLGPPGAPQGQMGNTALTFDFRTPRALLTAVSRVMGMVRMVEPAAAGSPTSANNGVANFANGVSSATPIINTVIPPMTSLISHKASLNTSLFGELWRAYINVLNDFPSEDGVTAPTGRLADTYYPLKVPGGNDQLFINQTTAAPNPVQFRSCMRDPTLGSTASDGNTCAQNASQLAFSGQSMLCLRAALGAANILTLRDQHGTNPGPTYFYPNRTPMLGAPVAVQQSEQEIQLIGAGGNKYNVYVYGVSAQPFITEVFVSNDTTTHAETAPNVGPNPNGLVVIKLFNPYPYLLSLKGYGLAMVNRSTGFATSAMTVQMMDTSAAAPPLAGVSIPALGYIILSNFNPTLPGYWPKYLGTAPAAGANFVEIDNLSLLIGGSGTATSGTGTPQTYELVLLAPRDAAGTTVPEVPVDSFDFTGFPAPIANGTNFNNWHYERRSGTKASGLTPDPTWKCVYPGPYCGTGFSGTQGAVDPTPTAGDPHYLSDSTQWTSPQPDPWIAPNQTPTKSHLDLTTAGVGTAMPGDSSDTTLTLLPATNPHQFDNFPGIQLCNVDFGGYNKFNTTQWPSGAANPIQFPWGGFARVGDAVQAPFIGSYVVFSGAGGPAVNWPPPVPAAGQPGTTVNIAEINPVTVDSALADDGDQNDDTTEQIGRCVPLVANTQNPLTAVDDFSMAGVYSFAQPVTSTVTTSFQGISPALWHYHFALELFNQFTVVTNPESDYTPNMEPNSWAGTIAPYPTSNTIATGVAPGTPVASDPANQGHEDTVASEGLINVNTASWRVLAALELVPRSRDANGVLNERLAQAIVHYRDIDDGVTRYLSVKPPATLGGPWQPQGAALPPQGHGPFNSLMELSQVFDYTTQPSTLLNSPMPNGRRLYDSTFQNALSPSTSTPAFPTDFSTETPRHQWGYYTPGPVQMATGNLQKDDWVKQYLMVDRVSNLLTTRSDMFTVYVVVQGWKNVTTVNGGAAAAGSLPELVVQSRLAATVDRSGIVRYSGNPKVTQFTTK